MTCVRANRMTCACRQGTLATGIKGTHSAGEYWRRMVLVGFTLIAAKGGINPKQRSLIKFQLSRKTFKVLFFFGNFSFKFYSSNISSFILDRKFCCFIRACALLLHFMIENNPRKRRQHSMRNFLLTLNMNLVKFDRFNKINSIV